MKQIILIITFLLFKSVCFGQSHRTDNWVFGMFSGLSFSTDTPTVVTGSNMYAPEGSSSISDTMGNLLFYSDGEFIWDASNTIMPNGNGLLGSVNSTQSVLIVPSVGNSDQYYVFTTPALAGWPPYTYAAYSIVDMTLNSGMGDVTAIKNVPLISVSCEKVTATRHSNGTDFWVVFHKYNTADYYSYLVTSSGLDTVPVISTTGTVIQGGWTGCPTCASQGPMKISPCGNLIALATAYANPSIVEIAKFNNSTGQVSCAQRVATFNQSQYDGVYGLEFSPDESKLYGTLSTRKRLLQWDLLAGNIASIAASTDTIWYSSGLLGALQLGIDGRIYLARYDNSGKLGCVTYPNQPGLACSFDPIFVSGSANYGLTNFISSDFCNVPVLGTVPLCVTGINNIEDNSQINISPNPFTSSIVVKMHQHKAENISFTILNSLGQVVFHAQENILSTDSKVLDLSFLSIGVYIFELTIDGERSINKLIKQ